MTNSRADHSEDNEYCLGLKRSGSRVLRAAVVLTLATAMQSSLAGGGMSNLPSVQ